MSRHVVDPYDFSVIIATKGRPAFLEATLEGIASCRPGPGEIIVVDGDEAKSAGPVVDRWAGTGLPVRHITSEPGLPRQRNLGIDDARGPILVFFDDDVEVAPDIFAALAEAYQDGTVVAATGKVIEEQTHRVVDKHSPIRRFLLGRAEGTFTKFGYPRRPISVDVARDMQFMYGSFMSVKREVARTVRFDESLAGYALGEDEDFSYRVSQVGRIRYHPRAVLKHLKLGFGSHDARAFARRVVINRSYIFRKNFPQTLRTRIRFKLFLGGLIIHRLINLQPSGAWGIVEGAWQARKDPISGAASRVSPPVSVCFISSHARSGGSESYLLRLVKRLGPHWVDGVLVLEDGPLVTSMREQGVPVDILPTGPHPLDLLRSAFEIRKSWKRRQPSAVHANGVKAAVVAGIAAIGSGVPIVWVKHDLTFDGPRARLIAASCDQVVAVSDAAASTFSARTLRRKVSVVPNGLEPIEVDRGVAQARMRDELGTERDTPIIGLMGRLHPVKNQIAFVDAAALVLERVPEAMFVLIGGPDPTTPDYEASVRARIDQRDLADRVRLLGHRSNAPAELAALTVGALCSEGPGGKPVEALPLSLLEMLAVGTPVVAYDIGGVREAVGPCGRMVPAGDVPGLAAALTALLLDADERERLARCGRTRVRERFSIDKMEREMRGIYERVAG